MLYVFPKDYRSKLATKSLRIQIEPFLEKAKVLSFVTIYRFELDCYLSSELSVMYLAGCCRLFDSCFVWHSAYSVYCYRLHNDYSPAFKQKVSV